MLYRRTVPSRSELCRKWIREIGTRYAHAVRQYRKAVGFPISPSPHPGGPLPILLAGRFPDFRRLQFADFLLATPSHSARGSSGLLVAFVPVTVAGAAPAFHQLPSPTNKGLRLSQNKNSVSSEAHGSGRLHRDPLLFATVCKCPQDFQEHRDCYRRQMRLACEAHRDLGTNRRPPCFAVPDPCALLQNPTDCRDRS
jgi:hypothetical protein